MKTKKKIQPFPEGAFFVEWKKFLKEMSFTEKEIKKIVLAHDEAMLLTRPMYVVAKGALHKIDLKPGIIIEEKKRAR